MPHHPGKYDRNTEANSAPGATGIGSAIQGKLIQTFDWVDKKFPNLKNTKSGRGTVTKREQEARIKRNKK